MILYQSLVIRLSLVRTILNSLGRSTYGQGFSVGCVNFFWDAEGSCISIGTIRRNFTKEVAELTYLSINMTCHEIRALIPIGSNTHSPYKM